MNIMNALATSVGYSVLGISTGVGFGVLIQKAAEFTTRISMHSHKPTHN